MSRRGLRALTSVSPAVLLALTMGAGSSAHAEGGRWTVEVEPMYVTVYGHDQHVLTIHRVDLDSTPRRDDKEAVSLATDDAFAYRGEFQYTRGGWGLGVDFFWFVTTQNVAPRRAAADGSGGPIDQVLFEVADRAFTSSNPGQRLFYDLLEDTDLEFWTVDLYALKTLAETPTSGVRLLVGLRVGDFDNDYRAAVGIENVGGSRLDSSSNYNRLMGPMVGLQGGFQRGRHAVDGHLSQSVLLGTTDKLTASSREFSGPLSESPAFFAQETFGKEETDVAIPISELRIKWTFRLSGLVSLVAGAQASAWFDVAVPPGVVPIADGDEAFHENTIVASGLFAGAKLTF